MKTPGLKRIIIGSTCIVLLGSSALTRGGEPGKTTGEPSRVTFSMPMSRLPFDVSKDYRPLAEGRWAEAVARLTQRLEADPEQGFLRACRAQAYAAQGEWVPAEADAQLVMKESLEGASIRIQPSEVRAREIAGCVLVEALRLRGEYARAAEKAQSRFFPVPSNPSGKEVPFCITAETAAGRWFAKSITAYDTKKGHVPGVSEAAAALREQFRPDLIGGEPVLGERSLWIAIRLMTSAIATLPPADQLTETNFAAWADCYLSRACGYWELGRPEAALADAQTALSVNPESRLGLFLRGLVREYQGKFAEARNDYESASKPGPDPKEDTRARVRLLEDRREPLCRLALLMKFHPELADPQSLKVTQDELSRVLQDIGKLKTISSFPSLQSLRYRMAYSKDPLRAAPPPGNPTSAAPAYQDFIFKSGESMFRNSFYVLGDFECLDRDLGVLRRSAGDWNLVWQIVGGGSTNAAAQWPPAKLFSTAFRFGTAELLEEELLKACPTPPQATVSHLNRLMTRATLWGTQTNAALRRDVLSAAAFRSCKLAPLSNRSVGGQYACFQFQAGSEGGDIIWALQVPANLKKWGIAWKGRLVEGFSRPIRVSAAADLAGVSADSSLMLQVLSAREIAPGERYCVWLEFADTPPASLPMFLVSVPPREN